MILINLKYYEIVMESYPWDVLLNVVNIFCFVFLLKRHYVFIKLCINHDRQAGDQCTEITRKITLNAYY